MGLTGRGFSGAAFDACAKDNGSTVQVPAGDFVIGLWN